MLIGNVLLERREIRVLAESFGAVIPFAAWRSSTSCAVHKNWSRNRAVSIEQFDLETSWTPQEYD
jgi:hypothetical protein